MPCSSKVQMPLVPCSSPCVARLPESYTLNSYGRLKCHGACPWSLEHVGVVVCVLLLPRWVIISQADTQPSRLLPAQASTHQSLSYRPLLASFHLMNWN